MFQELFWFFLYVTFIAIPAENNVEDSERQSVVTPCLLASVCKLLSNLIVLDPENTLENLRRKAIVHTVLG